MVVLSFLFRRIAFSKNQWPPLPKFRIGAIAVEIVVIVNCKNQEAILTCSNWEKTLFALLCKVWTQFEQSVISCVSTVFLLWPCMYLVNYDKNWIFLLCMYWPTLLPTGIMKLLRKTSIHLNKSLTRLKITFHETAQEYFLSTKLDNALSTFSPRPVRSKISSDSEPTRTMTLIRRTSIHLNKSLTRLKITFHETEQEYFLSSKIGTEKKLIRPFYWDQLFSIFCLSFLSSF